MNPTHVRLLTTLVLPFALIGGATGLLVYDGQTSPPASAAGPPKAAVSDNLPRADADDTKPPQRPLNVKPRPVADDKSIKYDYDIVYVRAPRFVKTKDKDQPAVVWPDAHHPTKMRVGGVDLM